MRITRRIAPALALGLLGLGLMPAARGQFFAGGNAMNNGVAPNGFGMNNGFGGFNNGFGPMGFQFANGNGNGFFFGFGGPMNGGMMAFGPGMGMNFGAPNLNMGFAPGWAFANPAMIGGGMIPPQGFAFNNLGGVAGLVGEQAMRRPAGGRAAVRRRRP